MEQTAQPCRLLDSQRTGLPLAGFASSECFRSSTYQRQYLKREGECLVGSQSRLHKLHLLNKTNCSSLERHVVCTRLIRT